MNATNRSVNKVRSLTAVALGAGALLSVAGWAFGLPSGLKASPSPAQQAPLVVNEAPINREGRNFTSFSGVVKKSAPSVVNIFSTKMVRAPRGFEMMPFDPFHFFGDPNDQNPGQRAPRSRKQQGLGSGVVVSKDGYILTNNHVVDGADEIKVSLAREPGREITAKVIGKDPKTDLAVLKIDASDLPVITLADSDKVEVGDLCLAIGNPFGLGQTVTMGIVSAMGRGDIGIEAYEDFIQTDAAINPGNSGGALIDVEGRLIGINTAILSGSGGNQGVGFAIPVNLARQVMTQLINTGHVTRGFLGIAPQDLTQELAKEFDRADGSGVLVGQVTEDSAAAEAGLKAGDIITHVNGKAVKDARNFRLAIAKLAPGSKVELRIARDGKERELKATLREFPEQKLASGNNDKSDTEGDALDGVEVGDLTSQLRSRYRIPPAVRGAIITNIDPNSASYEEGLRTGDVILEINRKPIRTADDAVEASKRVRNGRARLLIYSKGSSRFVVVDENRHR